MPKKQAETQGRVLTNTALKVGKNTFTLLNSEKLGRVMDLLEGVSKPKDDEAVILKEAQKLGESEAMLALYDRLGGAIKLGERKLAIGTFYNFAEKKPIAKPNVSEEDFTDEFVLQKKKTNKTKKAETTSQRIKRLESKAKTEKKTEKKEDKE